MPRVKIADSFGQSPRSHPASVRLLATAQSRAPRVQFSLEGLGGVSNMLLLAGVGAGVAVSLLSDLPIDMSVGFASAEGAHSATVGNAVKM